MAEDFQTTFIPKKKPEATQGSSGKDAAPAGGGKKKSVGLLMVVGVVLFVIALLLSGGVVLYENMLKDQITSMEQQLERVKGRVEPSFLVQARKLDTRLSVAQNLLKNHVSLSPLFTLLEERTLRGMSFQNLSYKMENGQPSVSMKGRASGYQRIAEQSKIFGESSFIKNHIFSNFNLTKKGNVSFNTSLTLSSDLVYFSNSLGVLPQQSEESSATSNNSGNKNTQVNQINSNTSDQATSSGQQEQQSGGLPQPNTGTGSTNQQQTTGSATQSQGLPPVSKRETDVEESINTFGYMNADSSNALEYYSLYNNQRL